MKYLKRLTLLALIYVMMTIPVSAASIDAQIIATQRSLNRSLQNAEKDILGVRYDIGAIYTTTEDVDAEDITEQFGGEWQEINSAFLWATDGTHDYYVDEDGDGKDDKTNETISPLHRINQRDGKSNYSLVAGIGSDDENIVFWTDDESAYVNSHNTVALSGDATTSATIAYGMQVVEKSLQEGLEEIMPPYTVVKVFERIS